VLADALLEGLNPEQQEAVQTTEGPLLVLAGAGSGKTRVLTNRVAWLIGVCGIAPEAILAVTFTNKAAGEMRERVAKLLGPDARGVWLSTFHSSCVRILRQEIGHLGRSRGFVIYDEDDSLSVVREALRRHGQDPKEEARRLRWRIDQWKNAGLLPAAAAERAEDLESEESAEVYATYQRLLAEANALDFGDLLLLTVELFERFPEVLRHYQERWQYVLVDEYQDTNRVQYRLVNQLAAAHQNLCVVGDPNQCLPGHTLVTTPTGPRRIDSLKEGETVVAACGWGGTRSAPIEKVMSRPHRGHLVRATLRSGEVVEGTPNHIVFGRIDPVADMHYVYLMWKREFGFRIGTTSGVRSSRGSGVLNGVRVRTNQETADALWILHAGRDPSEARFLEQLYSVQYGIPTLVFHVRGRRMALDQSWIDRLYAEVDSESGAMNLLGDLDLDARFPHHRPGAVVRGGLERRFVWFTVFGDARRSEHRVQLVTSGEELRRSFEGRFPVRRGARGTWRIETSRRDYDDAAQLAERICATGRFELVPRARLTPQAPFHFMPLAHLRPGMSVPVLRDGRVEEDVVESVERVPFDGEVFDLSIPELRNFAAAGVIVHNSIYRWRGADVKNILDFERDFPDAKVVTLHRNYRSTQRILSGAGAVVENNPGRAPKRMITDRGEGERIAVYAARDDRDEAQFVVRGILDAVRERGLSYGQCAVFYRTNAQSRPIEEELLKYDVPYVVVGGVRFYERAEVKDALSYLRLLVNPADAAATRRIVNRPARGIGKTTLERAEAIAAERGIPLFEALRAFAEADGGRAGTAVRGFVALIDSLAGELAHALPADAIARVLERTGYLRALEAEATPEAEARVENLRELLLGAEDFAAANAGESDARGPLEQFLDQVALVSDLDSAELRSDRVSLMTVHSAKGLEFKEVWVVGLEEGVLPHQASSRDPRAIEEERRLCYVAMTRAMERLALAWAHERRRYGSRSFGTPSRFLAEIPPALVEQLGAPSWDSARDAGPAYDYSYDQSRSARGASAADEGGVTRGMRVRHPIFGYGSVLEVIGSGPGQALRIRFDRAGVKKIIVRYANLELG
jgi:DNA helicase-2/ATP-dependent DNA helicase PcrA